MLGMEPGSVVCKANIYLLYCSFGLSLCVFSVLISLEVLGIEYKAQNMHKCFTTEL